MDAILLRTIAPATHGSTWHIPCPFRQGMLFVYICERCEDQGIGHSYRVISEDDGERLLDMMVCYGCYMEAAQLGLDTQTIEIHHVTLRLMSRDSRQLGHYN